MRRLTYLLVLFASTALAQTPMSGAQHARLVERARRFAREGRLDQAIAAFDSATVNAPFDPAMWIGYAGVLEQARRPADAARALTRAVLVGASFGARMEYRAARNFAMAGARDSAFAWLDRAMSHRFEGRAGMASDTAFARLRDDPRFQRLAGVGATNVSRDEGWRRDIDFLVAESQRLHAGLEREAFADSFVNAATELKRRVGSFSDDRIKLEMRAILARLGDGHTDVQIGFSRLPVDFYQFSDGLFIVRGTGPGEELVGAQVLSFGPITAERALSAIARYTPRDNDMGVRFRGPIALAQPIVLQAIGATPDTNAVSLTIRDRAGRTRTVSLPSAGRVAPQVNLPVPAGARSAPPVYMSETGPIWFRPLRESRALYLQYNAVADPPGQTMRQYVESLKVVLREQQTNHLIVDVRNNGGGNTFLYPPLLNAIIHFRESSPDHRVWVIIGRRTFSAAQNFVTGVERYVSDATFVGEPTGSRPNFVGESPPVVLPYSGTRLTISSRYHQNVDYTDRRMWIAPQVPAALTSADYFANRDPAMDAILELIRGTGAKLSP